MNKTLKYLPTGSWLTVALVLGLFVVFPSCRKTSYRTDIAGIELDLQIKRLECDLFALDFDSIRESVPDLYDRYGEFFDLFNYRIIQIGGARQITYPDYLKSFLSDYLNHQVYLKTMDVFPDLGDLEQTLTEAFKRYRVHFPDRNVPELYSFVSRFNQSIATAEDILAIGLDNYLGTDCEYYRRLGMYQYQIRNMYPGKIPGDCIRGWAMTEFEFNDSVNNLLANMIYHGKIAYFTKWMLPAEPDSVIMGFSEVEMKFCRNNEARMWEYLVEHRILFETDRMTIQKFTGNGPFTRDFTHESPAGASIWIGWRIVEAYMRRIPELTLEELMGDDDYQKILTLSKYNP
jgi:hypothetical protein